MATYEIGDNSARIIWQALDFYRRRFPNTEPHTLGLSELLELFAPPEPPTAEELAEALRRLAHSQPGDLAALTEAQRVLALWERAQS